MTVCVERRRQSRHFGRDLIVLDAAGRSYPVRDISVDGLCFVGDPFPVGDRVAITLASSQAPDRTVRAECRVVAISAVGTHMEFAPVTVPLLTFVLKHIGAEMGVTPYYFGNKQNFPFSF